MMATKAELKIIEAATKAADEFLDELYYLTKDRHQRQSALCIFLYWAMTDRTMLRANGSEDAGFRRRLDEVAGRIGTNRKTVAGRPSLSD